MSRWVESLQGLEVKVTGDFRRSPLRMRQREVEALLQSYGADVVGDIRSTTDLLIRADSPQWKFGDYGDREAELAGHAARRAVGVINVDELLQLLQGQPVWARDPQSPHPPVQSAPD